jgi:2-polyprenyl-6-methoxyphenol hydroxylase-like FAD-dependent oxidoreductase
MNASSIYDTDILIIGAGPTGLVLTLWLTRLGARVRIVDKTTEPGTTSRNQSERREQIRDYSRVTS